MNRIYKFDEFTNEEIGWKTALAGVALASTLTLGGCDSHKGFANLNKIEQIGNQSFKLYDLNAEGQHFDLTIKDNFMVAYHSYTETSGSGKDEHTETINVTNLFIPAGIKFIWYLDTYAGPKPFPGAHLIKMSDLEVDDDTPDYISYDTKGWFSSCPFNNIIVVKKNANVGGEEFKLTDNKLGYYTCKEINRDLYIITIKDLGGGNFGGAGASSSF